MSSENIMLGIKGMDKLTSRVCGAGAAADLLPVQRQDVLVRRQAGFLLVRALVVRRAGLCRRDRQAVSQFFRVLT
jgi:hypothetical protein